MADARGRRYLIWALAANAAIVIMECIVLFVLIAKFGIELPLHFTNDANVLALVTSLIFCIYAIRELRCGQPLPVWVNGLRLIAASALVLVFLIVAAYLAPTGADGNGPLIWFFDVDSRFTHALCPIVSFISIVFFEREGKLGKGWVFLGMGLTLLYGIILEAMNIARAFVGPYPFFEFYNTPLYMTVIWLVALAAVVLLIGFVVRKLRNRHTVEVSGVSA